MRWMHLCRGTHRTFPVFLFRAEVARTDRQLMSVTAWHHNHFFGQAEIEDYAKKCGGNIVDDTKAILTALGCALDRKSVV